MMTQGEIEAAICDGMARFELDFMGRGPKEVRAHLIGDFVVVRLHGALSSAEQHLVKSLPPEGGRDLLKEVRVKLVEAGRPLLESVVEAATGVRVVSLHHDLSTETGEKVVMFTLASTPTVRAAKK